MFNITELFSDIAHVKSVSSAPLTTALPASAPVHVTDAMTGQTTLLTDAEPALLTGVY